MYLSLWVDIAFHGTENLLDNIIQDHKRFPAKTFSESQDRGTFPFLQTGRTNL